VTEKQFICSLLATALVCHWKQQEATHFTTSPCPTHLSTCVLAPGIGSSIWSHYDCGARMHGRPGRPDI